jgi:hypothetical protein
VGESDQTAKESQPTSEAGHKLKSRNVRVMTSGDMTAVVWKEKCDMQMLINS